MNEEKIKLITPIQESNPMDKKALKLFNAEQLSNWAVEFFNIPELWKLTTGEKAIIFILDTGVSYHVDLPHPTANINYTRTNTAFDVVGHGVHVAGITSASDNEFGIKGIAPKAELVNVKVLDDEGYGTDESISKGIRFAANYETDKAKIINMSFGAGHESPKIKAAIEYAYSKGCIMVAAAGNHGTTPIMFPANMDEVISVGSINRFGEVSNFSARDEGYSLDLVSAGENIMSTYINNRYVLLSGTSMATPQISAIIALLTSIFEDLKQNPLIVKELLTETAYLPDNGQESDFGMGIVDPLSAYMHMVEKEQSDKIEDIADVNKELQDLIEKSTYLTFGQLAILIAVVSVVIALAYWYS